MIEKAPLKYQHTKRRHINRNGYLYDLIINRYLYLMFIPVIILYVIFAYYPIYGLTLAFKEYNFAKGIFGSPWIGLSNFKELFSDEYFFIAVKNTVILSFLKIVFVFPIPIVISLILNEITAIRFKKSVQTALFLPYFISWVVVSYMLTSVLSTDGGVINEVIKIFGAEPINFMGESKYYRWVLVFSEAWKISGWYTVIYMGAISAINPELYEASIIDGCNIWQRTRFITIPGISSTIGVLLIMASAYIMQGSLLNGEGFNQVFVTISPVVQDVGNIIDYYIYKVGLQQGKFALATASGLIQSVIGFILLISTNKIMTKVQKSETALF